MSKRDRTYLSSNNSGKVTNHTTDGHERASLNPQSSLERAHEYARENSRSGGTQWVSDDNGNTIATYTNGKRND